MISYEDFKNPDQDVEKTPYSLPDKIESIDVSYDNGRLSISINNNEVFYKTSGTQDCTVLIEK